MRVAPHLARPLGIPCIAVTITGQTVAAVVALGELPASLWMPAFVVGSVAFVESLTLFFRPWLFVGLGIDVAVLWLPPVLDGVSGDSVIP